MVRLGLHQQESMGSQRKNDFLNLKREWDREGSVHILVKVTLESGVTSLGSRTTEPCKGKLIIKRRNYAMPDEDELLPSLIPPLIVRRMVVIDVDQGLLLVSLSHMKRNTTMNADIRAQLAVDWETML